MAPQRNTLSKPRRSKPVVDPRGAVTPDFSRHVIVRVVPDLTFERALYRELRRAQRRIERLQKDVELWQSRFHERKVRGIMRGIAKQFKPSHNDNPTQRSK